MKIQYIFLCSLFLSLFTYSNLRAQGSCPDGSFQWSDIDAIISGAGCTTANCHGGTPGSSGLNMTTYANFTAGGNQCGTAILSGTQFVDIINVGNQACAGGTINNPMNNVAAGNITAQQSADIQAWIDAGAPEMCPPPSTCPTVILNDANLPNLPPAVCADDLLSLCFDVIVDEATFDPSLIQFGYDLTIDGAPSTVTLNTAYVSGGAIDPNATGQLCFEATVPAGTNPCAPYELALEIIDVFYNDPGCDMSFVAYDLNITTPIPLMQTGDNLNDLIPLLGIAGLNPILVQIYPNPNWTATVTQAPACDGATLGIIEINAADGTLCETLTDVGTAGMDGCPPTDAILPETLYENYTTYTDADGVEQPNPCAISITIPEQTIACEDQCIICPMVTNVVPPNNICPDAGMVTFCVEFDMVVDATTVLTVEGISVDGSAGGMQICVDIPFTAPFDPCNGAAIDFNATAICDGNDLLAAITWLSSQILPITDLACGGIAGCMDDTACNFDPNAICDDLAAPCLPAPACNTDPCLGDTEIVDPADPCQCIVNQVQVLGCTDANACNFDMTANCEDDTCDLGNTACADPCNPPNPDDGCALTTDTFDAATCTVTNEPTCPAGEVFDAINCACVTDVIPGCTDPCADNYDMNANEDNGSCNPYDMTCNTDCTVGDLSEWDAATCSCLVTVVTVLGCTDANACNYDMAANCEDNTCDLGNAACADPCNEPNPDDGCDITTDTFDAATCAVTNTPNCAAGETFDAANCLCTTDPVSGCTNMCADNYNPDATTDDGSCMFPNPDDGCDLTTDSYDDVNCVVINVAPDPDDGCDLTMDAFDAATCIITNTPNCAAGETFDAANCLCSDGPIDVTIVNIEDPCGCDLAANIDLDGDGLVDLFYEEITITAVVGISDWVANFTIGTTLDASGSPTSPSIIDNGDGTYTISFYLAANDSYTVDFTSASQTLMTGISGGGCAPCELCEDSISGSVFAEETGCSAAGIEVTIYDATGAVVGTVTTDANGDYALMGVFSCGDYTAELTANVPACYSDSGGTSGPIGFTVNGDGVSDGANFMENPQVPTLSQWGLIILALLLMNFGALSLGFRKIAYLKPTRQ